MTVTYLQNALANKKHFSRRVLKEGVNSDVIMLRRDGKVFTDIGGNAHPYILRDPSYSMKDNLHCLFLHPQKLIFFYNNSNIDNGLSEDVQCKLKKVVHLFNFIIHHCDDRYRYSDFPRGIVEEIANFMPQEWNYILEDYSDDEFDVNKVEYDLFENMIYDANDACNRRFLRLRFGGWYNDDEALGKNQLYVRVGKSGGNWFNVLWKFVCDNPRISAITITYDWQSLGEGCDQVVRIDGTPIDGLSRDEFLIIGGSNPWLEKLNFRTSKGRKLYEDVDLDCMIMRDDGAVFNSLSSVHPYILRLEEGTDLPNDALFAQVVGSVEDRAIEFFIKNTQNDFLKQKLQDCISVILYLADAKNADKEFDFVAEQIRDNVTQFEAQLNALKPYADDEFMNLINAEILTDDFLQDLFGEANYLSNQEFLRIRMSDKYYGNNDPGHLYARISSDGVNWYNNLVSYIADHPEVKYISVGYDRESGKVDKFAKFKHQDINRMSVEEFICQPGRPYLEKLFTRKLNESDSDYSSDFDSEQGYAVMLRRDGEDFDGFETHPYLKSETVSSLIDSLYYMNYNIEDFEFFYFNSNMNTGRISEDVQAKLKKFIHAIKFAYDNADYYRSTHDHLMIDVIGSIDNLLDYLDYILDDYDEDEFSLEDVNYKYLDDLLNEANDACNKRFLRLRFGHWYNPYVSDESILYVRVGPEGGNWFDVLWKYVYDHPRIKSITITYDWQSRKDKSTAYVKIDNKPINGYTRQEFLEIEGGHPWLEKLNSRRSRKTLK